MPVLPVDYPEPFAAVLGTMLYPNEGEAAQRRAFAAHCLAEPIRRFEAAGGALAYNDLSRIVKDGGARLDDLDQRWWHGTAMGELFKILFAFANHKPERASWEYSARIVEKYATTAKVSGARTSIMAAKRRFLTVAHLWGAYSIRGREFRERVEVHYHYADDFESFLTEAEILRKWGQTWKADAAKAKSPLPAGTWAMPEIWTPAPRKPGWPPTGMIPGILPPHDLLPPPLAAADGRAGSAENSVQNFADTFFERVTSGYYRHRTSLAVAGIHVGEKERCADRRHSGTPMIFGPK